VRIVIRGRKVKVADSALLLFVLGGLLYDNLMLGLGANLFHESSTFLWLSVPRFLMHGLFTPFLIIQVALCCDRLNVPGYRSRGILTLWGATAFLAIFIGLTRDVNLHLVYTVKDGVVHYTEAGSAGPPIAEITTVISLLVMGMTLMRFVRWPWVLIASLAMFSFALFWLDNGALQNLGEIMLLSSCVATGAYAVVAAERERDEKKQAALAKKKERTLARASVEKTG
jgi:hypothetical protein